MKEAVFFKKNKPLTIESLFSHLNIKNKDKVKDVKSLKKSGINDLTFFDSLKYKSEASNTKASFCITTAKLEKYLPNKVQKIVVKNVLFELAKVLKKIYPNADIDYPDNSLKSVSKKTIKSVKFSNNVLIGKNVKIGKNTVIGRWLRSKSTIIKINDIMFTHGGISKEFFSSVDFDLEKINRDMRESIDLSIDEMVSNNFYNIYFGEKSLTWYRGYYYHDITDKQLNKLLDKIEAKRIVVGHSSNDNILEFYDNIIYCVDSSMKLGKYGEILLIKNNVFYRGTLDGELIEL